MGFGAMLDIAICILAALLLLVPGVELILDYAENVIQVTRDVEDESHEPELGGEVFVFFRVDLDQTDLGSPEHMVDKEEQGLVDLGEGDGEAMCDV